MDDVTDIADMEMLLQLFLLTVGVLMLMPESRNPSFFEQRLAWERYSERHSRRGTFKIRMRMKLSSFNKLLEWIYDSLLVSETHAKRRGGTIIPELCLYCTLRYLAGGSYLDICDIAGISKSSFYRVIWKTVTAIVKCPALAIRFPTTPEEIQAAIVGFASISTEQAIINCVGVVDGYLLRIRVPAKKETPNVRSFFSGHYQCYGVNIQAVTDHNSRFIFFAFAAPGVTGDRDAIKQCALYDLIEGLPHGMCIIGDAAYIASEHLVPCYMGVDKTFAKYDNFNYYASQCRIRVEMAFGMMQMKWGILQRSTGCTIANTRWLAQAVARLHNFCIDERLDESKTPFDTTNIPRYIPSIPHGTNGDPVQLNPLFSGALDGQSFLREWMASRVQRLQLVRPGNTATTVGPVIRIT